MITSARRPKVLYSFPHRIGAGRIATTAWYQVDGLIEANVDVRVLAASIERKFHGAQFARPTLVWGGLKIPVRVLGGRWFCMLHDWIVAQYLSRTNEYFDLVHVWPLGGLRTIRAARKRGIVSVMERPNAHTRYAYQIVQDECRKLGVMMPPGHEHDYDRRVLEREEREYGESDFLLCPSEFVKRTFLDYGFEASRLVRTQYGSDSKQYYPGEFDSRRSGLVVIFVGGCAPRKGLHYALEAWLASKASRAGRFLIAGEFIPGYFELLKQQLSHPSVKVLGHRKDIPKLMRDSDVLVLPSIEEGSALVTSEARSSGCVLLVSEASGAICKNGVDAFVHAVGDVRALKEHFDVLSGDRGLLFRMRETSLATRDGLSWNAAGVRLKEAYFEALARTRRTVTAEMR
jgi:glycosyltransferase involved in cell wall biosynthesis